MFLCEECSTLLQESKRTPREKSQWTKVVFEQDNSRTSFQKERNIQSVVNGLPLDSIYTEAVGSQPSINSYTRKTANMRSMCTDCMEEVESELQKSALIQIGLQEGIGSLPTDPSTASFETRLGHLLHRLELLVPCKYDELETMEKELQSAQTRLQLEETKYWENVRRTMAVTDKLDEKQDSLTVRSGAAKRRVRQLQCLHAFNDAFYIWKDRLYGTINGFRLGYLLGMSKAYAARNPSSTVEIQSNTWEEVNTAWGLSAMLLNAIAQSVDFKFQNFEIVTLGSRTKVRQLHMKPSAYQFLTKRQVDLQLYYEESPPVLLPGLIDRITNSRAESFNSAMRGFMVCVNELSKFAMKTQSGADLGLDKKMYEMCTPENTCVLPKHSCTINGDFIEMEHSNSKSANDIEEAYRWTVALRHLLTNLKWLLVWSVRNKT